MSNSQDKHIPSASINIDSGQLSGLQLPNNTLAFLGIPYAAPPTSSLRWRPPQHPLPWTGVRDAVKFGPSAVHFPPPPTSLYFGGETEFSEDCLFLNVWTGFEGEGKRPVLVWFHMGAFQFGSGLNPMYDGGKLAEEGVTVVTVNYRLGRFGFLAHSELSAESEYQASGNYGIMDQIAALEWVQRNIQSFGGDPGNVTIGGASAGGSSVQILRSSPLAKGLFSKAICESGTGVTPLIDGSGPGHVATFSTLTAAEQAGAELLQVLGISSVAELRELPAEKIVSTFLPRAYGPWKADLWPYPTSLSVFDTATAIIDGHVLSESPLAALLSGTAADIPLLAGHVGNEASGMPSLRSLAEYRTYVAATFQEQAEEVLRLYPATTDAEVQRVTSQLLADQCFVWPTWTSARLQVKNFESLAWYYRFLAAPVIPQDSDVIERKHAGAFHGVGVPYAFGNLDSWQPQWDWKDSDRTLSKNVLGAWARFLRTGSPSDADSWPAVKTNGGLIMNWDLNSKLETSGEHLDKISAFWDLYYGLKGDI